eukprot:TRINITY_DN4051_c1_g1_i1.p1 TRINITY_DN4051_c1_g1~~TRINITY_DN4051_c1_g1_i1.p1  ORF type:complete len:287 (+),score=27.30 TRINITY_DN4051_c1_g1_i1:3-863(+)
MEEYAAADALGENEHQPRDDVRSRRVVNSLDTAEHRQKIKNQIASLGQVPYVVCPRCSAKLKKDDIVPHFDAHHSGRPSSEGAAGENGWEDAIRTITAAVDNPNPPSTEGTHGIVNQNAVRRLETCEAREQPLADDIERNRSKPKKLHGEGLNRVLHPRQVPGMPLEIGEKISTALNERGLSIPIELLGDVALKKIAEMKGGTCVVIRMAVQKCPTQARLVCHLNSLTGQLVATDYFDDHDKTYMRQLERYHYYHRQNKLTWAALYLAKSDNATTTTTTTVTPAVV